MKVLTQQVSAIIPDGVLSKVINELNAMTECCGGVTKTEVRGEWVSDEGQWFNEHGTRYEWWASGNATSHLQNEIIIAMLRAGEEAVMVQRGTFSVLYTRKDFPEVFDN